MDITQAKAALDKVIQKARIHLYKPIQIAEILYHHRVEGNFDLSDLESYRSISKRWRDDISLQLLGSKCTSSCKFQDNLFEANAVPPEAIVTLAAENEKNDGAVEAYIYRLFDKKHSQLQDILDYCNNTATDRFDIKDVIGYFWNEPGLKRSLDKVYEIIVYALFITIIEALELKVSISINESKADLLKEFKEFARSIMQIDIATPISHQKARIFRVGVTNAADRGLDMYSNWGPAIQIKHLSLDEKLASSIVDSVNADRVVIVCKDVEKKTVSLRIKSDWLEISHSKHCDRGRSHCVV